MTTTPHLTPHLTFRADSLAARVIGFFQHNPDEELYLEDITEKFDATRGNIHTLLAPATQAGALQRTRNQDGDYIYKAGKTLPARSPVQPPAAATKIDTKADTKPAKKAPSGYQSPRLEIDFTALQVDEGVPFESTCRNKGASKWAPLFARLTKPGQSIALPGHVRGAVGAAIGKINREKTHGTYRIAMTGADSARIWRVA